jgi:hypothetical protein
MVFEQIGKNDIGKTVMIVTLSTENTNTGIKEDGSVFEGKIIQVINFSDDFKNIRVYSDKENESYVINLRAIAYAIIKEPTKENVEVK